MIKIRRAPARSILVTPLVLGKQAQAQSTEASSKGFHIGATRPRPAGQQDEGHREAQDGVITRALSEAKTAFVRIACTSCLPSILGVVGSLPAYIWEENQGTISRT